MQLMENSSLITFKNYWLIFFLEKKFHFETWKWFNLVLSIIFIAFIYSSGGWKIQKMVKKSWLSVKKMWIWCEKYQKKFGLNWRFPWRAPAKTCSLVFGSAICPLQVICKAICGPKKFHPVCLTFDPLGLQMTTIAQNDQNLLRI